MWTYTTGYPPLYEHPVDLKVLVPSNVMSHHDPYAREMLKRQEKDKERSDMLTLIGHPVDRRFLQRHSPYQRRLLHRPHLNLFSPKRTPTPPPTGTHISQLYPDILTVIFSYLNVPDKGAAAQVCSTWRDTLYQKLLWKDVEAKLHLMRNDNAELFQCLSRRGIKKVQILSVYRSFKKIVELDNLTSLNLSGCYNVHDEMVSDAFSKCIPTLTYLNLSLCKRLTDQSIWDIADSCLNLETLEIGGCVNITDSGLGAVAALSKLKYLNLKSCWGITDKGILTLTGRSIPDCNCSSSWYDQDNSSDKARADEVRLEKLNLQDCQHLSDTGLKYISVGFTSLKSLNLSFCFGISDVGLRYTSKMSSLDELKLRSCDNITDVGVGYLAFGSAKITKLDLSFCDKITDQSLDYMGNGLSKLQCISLSSCPITNQGLRKLTEQLADLRVLNVGQCAELTDGAVEIILENLKKLESIDLYGCPKISTRALATLTGKLPSKCTLNLLLWLDTQS